MAGSMPVKVKMENSVLQLTLCRNANGHNNRLSCHGFSHAFYSAPLILTLEHWLSVNKIIGLIFSE